MGFLKTVAAGTGFRVVSSFAVVCLMLVAMPVRAADQQFITIGTAGVTGIYYPAGGAICRIVNEGRSEHGVRCSMEATLGSIANVEKIRRGELEFGFVQSDWQHHAFNGTSVFQQEGAFPDLRSVFSLHAEAATLVVRSEASYKTFDDLKGARVNAGSEGSGSEASFSVLVDRLGWSESDLRDVTNFNSTELAEALCSGQIDAYFLLIGHPAGVIEETAEQCGIRLIGIDDKSLDTFLEHAPYYMRTEIPAGLYGLEQPVASYGVVATVVTSAKLPDSIVYTLVKAVFDGFESFNGLHPALTHLKARDMAGVAMAAPLHPGALKFFSEKGLLPAR